MPVDIPLIETERLILRDHRLSDFEDYAAMWRDPVVTRFIGGRGRSREESWIRFLRHAGMWHHLGFGFWCIADKQSGRLIGEGGFHELLRDMAPSIEGTLETGWTLLPEAHGKGIAHEAVSAMLNWGRSNFPGRRITCFIDPGNAASIRLAEKLGFTEWVRSKYDGEDVILFEHKPR